MTLAEPIRPATDRIPSAPARLAALLADDLAALEGLIAERMHSAAAPRIPELAGHLIGAGGKRLRPLLVLAAARLVGARGSEAAQKLAVAVEFIHSATLLHDDVVDVSAQRRGRPTANVIWDNTSAVLVGDYLFARAFELMVETGSLDVLRHLSRASATITEGEVLQLVTQRDLGATEETYLAVVRGKTAALFEAATRAGGTVAGATAEQERALAAYGDALGIAFQIADDLLDYEGDDGIGKDRGDDLREGKMTLPVIRALGRADEAERAFWTRTLGRGEVVDGDVAQARVILDRHGALAAARAEALGWADRARAALAALPAGEIRDALADLADHAVTRRA